MFRFIVTGGAGFIGSHLVDRLIFDGYQVVAIDNLVTGSLQNLQHQEKEPRFEFVQADLAKGFPEVGSVDGIFHLASPASPKDFVPLALEILKVGSQGTFHVLDFASRNNIWILQASTSEVYGDPQVHPQTEDYRGWVDPIGVRSVYDESKRFSEALVMAYHRKYHLPTSLVRIFNTYGPRMRKDDGRVIPNFISQALSGEPITLYGDGSQTRSFCYVDDLIEGLCRFAKKKPLGPINLGNSQEITVRELAQVLIRLTHSSSPMVFQPLPEGDPKKRRPDLTRAKSQLEWSPTTPLETGLQKTVDYFQQTR